MAHHITKNNPKGRPGRISLFRLDLAPWKYSVMCIGTSKFDVIEYVFHSANPPVHYMTKNGRKSGSGGLFLVLLDLALWKSSKMYIATNKIHLIRYIFDRFTIRSNIGPRCPDRFGWIGYLWSWLTQLHENQSCVCMLGKEKLIWGGAFSIGLTHRPTIGPRVASKERWAERICLFRLDLAP